MSECVCLCDVRHNTLFLWSSTLILFCEHQLDDKSKRTTMKKRSKKKKRKSTSTYVPLVEVLKPTAFTNLQLNISLLEPLLLQGSLQLDLQFQQAK